jgi:hypothetical protein
MKKQSMMRYLAFGLWLAGGSALADTAAITTNGSCARGFFTAALTCSTSGNQLTCTFEQTSGLCAPGFGRDVFVSSLPLGSITQLQWDDTEAVLAFVCAQASTGEFCWKVEADLSGLGSASSVDDIHLVIDPAASSQIDTDGDGVQDYADAFPFDPAETADTDNDGLGDNSDNCPLNGNADQADRDSDNIGDACDIDNDNDSVPDVSDNCPLATNNDQLDTDSDGLGDVCDPAPNDADSDHDGVFDPDDNCPLTSNVDQLDSDSDGQGDVCDGDDDNDTVADTSDNCPLASNTDQLDNDSDKRGNVCDAFPADFCGYTDTDVDGKPDVMNCFRDNFNRTTLGSPWRGNSWTVNGSYARSQTTLGYLELDIALTAPTNFSFSYRSPGVAGFYTVNSTLKDLPSISSPNWGTRSVTLQAGTQTLQWFLANPDYPLDIDNLVIGPVTALVLDDDDDNDGVLDIHDVFPLNPAESLDTDGDGIGNNADLDADGDGLWNSIDWDDDNDGVLDDIDAAPLNPGNKNEMTLPLDSLYKGGVLRSNTSGN